MRFWYVLALAVAASAVAAAPTDLIEGNPASPVKVTIYEDLQCANCAALRVMLDEKLLPRYGTKVAFIHRDMPQGRHVWARPAAMAARWIFEQSPRLAILFRRELMSEQDHITGATLEPWVMEFAARNRLDPRATAGALKDDRLATLVDQDIQGATARGVKKIPAVYVAGQTFTETIIYDDLARVLDATLAR